MRQIYNIVIEEKNIKVITIKFTEAPVEQLFMGQINLHFFPEWEKYLVFNIQNSR